MNPLDLSVTQLKRAAAIKEQIDALNRELRNILGGPVRSAGAPKKKWTMSTAVKRKIAASQRARWARLRGNRKAARSVQSAAKTKMKR